MKMVPLGKTGLLVPAVAVGCMRFSEMSPAEMNRFMHEALSCGANFFDHADIYGGGKSEAVFGEALKNDGSIRREDLLLQSKCSIRPHCYDSSKTHILQAVDGILQRLHTDYLDVLLLHRPDALLEPEEVAEAFQLLADAGKVRYFGVSNYKPMQIALLQQSVAQGLEVNQLQFSLPVSNLVASGMEVNMETPGSVDHDGSALDYCRLQKITIQAWSPFQMPAWKGCFLGSGEYAPLNQALEELGASYGVSATAIAAAWVMRHPAQMQLIAGTTNARRLKEIAAASRLQLTRQEWYKLYLAAGHILP